jgi:hypothetical protein
MQIIPFVHLVAAIIAAMLAIPLIQRKVKMNHWYGFRVPAAFESEAAWFDINRYGGRLLLAWSAIVAVTAIVGLTLEKQHSLSYCWTSGGIMMGGLAVMAFMASSYAKKKTAPNKALEPTIMAVTDCAPSSTLRASHDRGSV